MTDRKQGQGDLADNLLQRVIAETERISQLPTVTHDDGRADSFAVGARWTLRLIRAAIGGEHTPERTYAEFVADQPDFPAREQDDTLSAWLHQRFGKVTSGVDWDELYETDQEYWAHHAAAVRRAVARGGFKNPARDQPKPESQLTARGLTPREAMLRLLGEAADTPERAATYNEAADKERASAIADRERAADTVLDQRVAAALEQKPTA